MTELEPEERGSTVAVPGEADVPIAPVPPTVTEADLALQGTLLESMLGYPASPPLEELSPGAPSPPEA